MASRRPPDVRAPGDDGQKGDWRHFSMRCTHCNQPFTAAGNGPSACQKVPKPQEFREEKYHSGQYYVGPSLFPSTFWRALARRGRFPPSCGYQPPLRAAPRTLSATTPEWTVPSGGYAGGCGVQRAGRRVEKGKTEPNPSAVMLHQKFRVKDEEPTHEHGQPRGRPN